MRYSAGLLPFSVLTIVFGCSKPSQRSDDAPATVAAASALPESWPYAHTDRTVTAAHGMVATDAPLATHVGAEVLRKGGNAVDAAVATAFALAVVFPGAGNVGGGGFFVLHMGDGREATLDFRETAPGAATRNMYLDSTGHADDRSITGALSAGVPGSVAGLWEAHKRFGSRPWAQLVAPAIELAEKGFTIDSEFVGEIHGDSARLVRFPASKALFLPQGHVPRAGEHWSNPDLAAVLRRVAADGPKGFYEGRTAELIAAEMHRGGGIITKKDLASYRAKWRDPIAFDYRGHHVIAMPPPSSGGITMAIVAHELSHYDARAASWHSPQQLHLLAEGMRRGFAVRNEILGDPDFVTIPTSRLLSQAYADSLASSIVADRATPSTAIRVSAGGAIEGHQTTHFSVVDGQGGAVAVTTTINGLFGSAEVVTGAGFFLNDEMDDFASEPGKPNMFGLVQGEANAIAPGKRMLSSMTPTIVLGADGTPMLVTGASGGPTIISSAFQVMSNVIDFGMDIGPAVSTPRVHMQHLPDTLFYEKDGLTKQTLDALTSMGYETKALSRGDIGIGASILRGAGVVKGTPDPRVHGSAEGY
jgi:gamma-glutamyltranspeptidase/glutathione hydrolase